MADKRAFFKLDVGYLTNPKIAVIAIESPTAIIMHIASVAYSAQHLTDGTIPVKLIMRLSGGTASDVDLLRENGLWHLSEEDCETCEADIAEGSAYVHDFLEHNRSSGEAKRVSDKASLSANARWKKQRNAERMPSAYETHAEGNANAMPREREREREEEAKASSPKIARPDIDQVIQGFSELLTANDVKHKPGESWRTAARLLIDKDGYTPEQVLFVARFATTDEFWMSNILSLPKLREKFEALKIKAQGNKPKTGSQVRLQAGFDLLQETRAEMAGQLELGA